MRRIVLLIACVAVAASACASASDDTTSVPASSGDTTLTVYSGRAEELVQPLVDRFTEETGIDVTVRYAGSADLAATILEEGVNSPADVFFAQDPASLGSVALAGLLAPLDEDILDAVPARLSAGDGTWVGVSGRSRVVAYDSTRIDPADLPETEDGFTDAAWAGRVAIAPTNASFLAYVAAKILLDGEDETAAWLEGMAANGAPTYPSNSVIVTAIDDGQVEAGLVNHYYLLRARAEDPDVVGRNHFFSIATAGSLVMPAGAGILAGTAHAEAAERFVRFLLGEEAQEYFATETFEYPLIEGVAPDPSLPPLDSLSTPDLDLSLLATTLDLATDLVARAGLL